MHPELLEVIKFWNIGGVRCQIPGFEEIDLLFHLTKKNSGFEKLVRKQADGKYRMLVFRESMTSYYNRKHGEKRFHKIPPTFAWQGWALFTKDKDQIFIDNRWFQVGGMNSYNLNIEPRDVQAEVRRKNWGHVPGGGLARPMTWHKEKEDQVSDMIKFDLTRRF